MRFTQNMHRCFWARRTASFGPVPTCCSATAATGRTGASFPSWWCWWRDEEDDKKKDECVGFAVSQVNHDTFGRMVDGAVPTDANVADEGGCGGGSGGRRRNRIKGGGGVWRSMAVVLLLGVPPVARRALSGRSTRPWLRYPSVSPSASVIAFTA